MSNRDGPADESFSGGRGVNPGKNRDWVWVTHGIYMRLWVSTHGNPNVHVSFGHRSGVDAPGNVDKGPALLDWLLEVLSAAQERLEADQGPGAQLRLRKR